jgi:lysophospholipase L1-like esterase
MGTAVAQAKDLEPTFVALWVGGNDVLRAALGGTVVEGVTMTPVDDFRESYQNVVTALTENGAGLVVANVPNVGDIPFMNTVPPFVVNPETGEPVEIGGEIVPLIGPDGPLSPLDKVTLLAPPYLAAGCGIPPQLGGGPDEDLCPDGTLPGNLILDVAEQGEVSMRVDDFNEIIAEIAAANGAALFDFASFLSDANQNGVVIGGIEYTTEFIFGGLVSFDGFHPNPLVSALNANGLIRAINRTYRASIPLVDLTPWISGDAGNVGPPQGIPTISLEAAAQIERSLGLPVIDPAAVATENPARGVRPGTGRVRGLEDTGRDPRRSRRNAREH